eukprot:368347-Hanusia_phi.AAC.1
MSSLVEVLSLQSEQLKAYGQCVDEILNGMEALAWVTLPNPAAFVSEIVNCIPVFANQVEPMCEGVCMYPDQPADCGSGETTTRKAEAQGAERGARGADREQLQAYDARAPALREDPPRRRAELEHLGRASAFSVAEDWKGEGGGVTSPCCMNDGDHVNSPASLIPLITNPSLPSPLPFPTPEAANLKEGGV